MENKSKPKTIFGRFKSIQSAMMLSFSLLTVLAVLIFLFIALRYTRNTVFENSITYTTQIVKQVNYDIDSYIDYMQNISSVVANNSDVSRYLFDDKQTTQELAAEKERVLSQLNTITESRGDIYNIAAMSGNGRNLVNSGEEDLNENIDIEKLDWYQAALQSMSGIAVSSSHVQNAIKSSYKWVITLSRALTNYQNGDREGVLFVDLNYSAISDLCDNNSIGSRGYMFILDEAGNVIYHPKQQLMYGGLMTENIEAIMSSESSNLMTDEGEDSKLYTMSKSEKTGWTVVGAAYTSELLKNNKQTQLLYFLVAAALLVGVIIISSIISKEITKPIGQLRDSMSMVEAGEFEKANVEVTANNEVGSLSKSFNVMTERIHTLMEQNVYEQKQKRKSELKALQSQINPHFLYNTLDSIIWMSEAGKNEEVVLMTAALARLFRQSISNEKEQITISEEIEYVKNYLTIQKMRYQDKMEYSIHVDCDIMSVKIIKFALQPLVENAIYHGLKYKETKGNLQITGFAKGQKVYIVISDDGVGMDQETLSGIFEEKAPSYKSNGVGVTNVQKRLQLYYGAGYGIRYESKKGVGTNVTVTIPLDGGHDEENM